MGATGRILRKMERLQGTDRKSTEYHKRNRRLTGKKKRHYFVANALIYGDQGTEFDTSPEEKSWQTGSHYEKPLIGRLHLVESGQILVNPHRQRRKKEMERLGLNGKQYRKTLKKQRRMK